MGLTLDAFQRSLPVSELASAAFVASIIAVVMVAAALIVVGTLTSLDAGGAGRIAGRPRRAGVAGARVGAGFRHHIQAYPAPPDTSTARRALGRDVMLREQVGRRHAIDNGPERRLQIPAGNAADAVRRGDDGGRYDRMRPLGQGGAGRTWLAMDRARDELVVVKEALHEWHGAPGSGRRLVREADLAARVRHPNVVRVVEVVDGSPPALVMEHVEGGSLQDWLSIRGTLTRQDALAVVRGVLEGLAEVHRAGIVHRDVKPANILIDADGRPKLADFGIAIRRPRAGDLVTSEEDARPCGTRSYSAPEVLDGRVSGSERADIYAVGAVLHHCLAGYPPDPPGCLDPSVADGALGAVLARAVAPDPEHRFPDADSFRAAIGGVVSLDR